MSVAAADLRSGEEGFVRADERFHAASTMKLAVLAAAHRLAATRELRLGGPVLVEDRFASLVDGSQFAVGDDGDEWTRERIGRAVPLRALTHCDDAHNRPDENDHGNADQWNGYAFLHESSKASVPGKRPEETR